MDRALADPSWLQVYPHTQVLHLPRLYSEHSPILIATNPIAQARRCPFRGLIAWTSHPDLLRFFNRCWDVSGLLLNNISKFQEQAPIWHQKVFGDIIVKKKRIRAHLGGIQRTLEIGPSAFLEQL